MASRGNSERRPRSRRRWLWGLALLGLSQLTLGAEPQLGRVVSVDEEKGEMVLLFDATGDKEAHQLTLPISDGGPIAVGDLMRVWTDDNGIGPPIPRPPPAAHTTSPRPDPTGVRSRLMLDRGPGRPHPPGERRGR